MGWKAPVSVSSGARRRPVPSATCWGTSHVSFQSTGESVRIWENGRGAWYSPARRPHLGFRGTPPSEISIPTGERLHTVPPVRSAPNLAQQVSGMSATCLPNLVEVSRKLPEIDPPLSNAPPKNGRFFALYRPCLRNRRSHRDQTCRQRAPQSTPRAHRVSFRWLVGKGFGSGVEKSR